MGPPSAWRLRVAAGFVKAMMRLQVPDDSRPTAMPKNALLSGESAVGVTKNSPFRLTLNVFRAALAPTSKLPVYCSVVLLEGLETPPHAAADSTATSTASARDLSMGRLSHTL